jgi:D-methionine transport system permease protein
MTEDNIQLALSIIPWELWNTVYMVACSALVAFLFGFPLGIILTITDKGHIKANKFIHGFLGAVINVGRSFPFAILMVALIPVTRWIAGTSLGTTASVIPLSFAAIPFVARIVETSLKEIDKGMIEAAVVMGSSPLQIILKVLIPESLPSLILGFTTTVINLVGYSAMAGTMGGGGLGKVAVQYGYQRFNVFLIIVTVIVLIALVQFIQETGRIAAKKILSKRGKSFSNE